MPELRELKSLPFEQHALPQVNYLRSKEQLPIAEQSTRQINERELIANDAGAQALMQMRDNLLSQIEDIKEGKVKPSNQMTANEVEKAGRLEPYTLEISKAPKSHVHHAIKTTFTMVDHCTNRIKSYLSEMDSHSAKIEFLENFKQHLNAAGNEIDWESDSEKIELVEKAKAHGVVFPEGELKWNSDQIKALVKNTDSRINPLMSQNDQNKTMLGYFKQKESELYAMLSNILKMDHETIMHNLRSWA